MCVLCCTVYDPTRDLPKVSLLLMLIFLLSSLQLPYCCHLPCIQCLEMSKHGSAWYPVDSFVQFQSVETGCSTMNTILPCMVAFSCKNTEIQKYKSRAGAQCWSCRGGLLMQILFHPPHSGPPLPAQSNREAENPRSVNPTTRQKWDCRRFPCWAIATPVDFGCRTKWQKCQEKDRKYTKRCKWKNQLKLTFLDATASLETGLFLSVSHQVKLSDFHWALPSLLSGG